MRGINYSYEQVKVIRNTNNFHGAANYHAPYNIHKLYMCISPIKTQEIFFPTRP